MLKEREFSKSICRLRCYSQNKTSGDFSRIVVLGKNSLYLVDSVVEWFKNWFNEDYLLAYGSRNALAAEKEIDLLADWAGLKGVKNLCDLGCGAGRHLPPLSRFAEKVVGIDLSPSLLKAAESMLESLPQRQRERISLINGDMRELPFESRSFDFFCSLFSSFGYLEHDLAHKQTLEHWASKLCSGGRLCLDLMNPRKVVSALVPTSERVEDGVRIVEERSLSNDGHHIEKLLTFTALDGTKRRYEERVRLFEREEISTLLESAGFQVLTVRGNFLGESYQHLSERLIVLGQR